MKFITFLSFIIAFLMFGFGGYNIGLRNYKQPEIKSCECVTYSQYALWSEKYNRYVSENKSDSVAKYAELLNQIK